MPCRRRSPAPATGRPPSRTERRARAARGGRARRREHHGTGAPGPVTEGTPGGRRGRGVSLSLLANGVAAGSAYLGDVRRTPAAWAWTAVDALDAARTLRLTRGSPGRSSEGMRGCAAGRLGHSPRCARPRSRLAGAGAAEAAFTQSAILGSARARRTGQLDGPAGRRRRTRRLRLRRRQRQRAHREVRARRRLRADVGEGRRGRRRHRLRGLPHAAARPAWTARPPGETQGVEDVAVSPDGSAVYVTDDGNRRVHQYAPDGTFVRDWGQDGTAGGDLRRPQGIAVGPSGDVYVTETINNRVSQFTAARRLRARLRRRRRRGRRNGLRDLHGSSARPAAAATSRASR